MENEFLLWLMVFIRASALLAVVPVFSSHNFPVQLRVALAAFTAFLIAPSLPTPALPGSFIEVVLSMSREVGMGLLLGFVTRMIFYALEFAGAVISAEVGLSFAPEVDPFNQVQMQAPGLILYWLAVMLMFSMDLHHWMLVGFQRSYVVLPIGGGHLHEALLLDVIRRTSRIFVCAVQMSAPLIAVSFIITLIFSILGRAVPQMNVFSESWGVRIFAGLAVFGLTMNLMAQQIVGLLRQVPEDMFHVARLLGAP